MLTLITGGHGSGKTAMALNIASAYARKTYIATAEPLDDELRLKIKKHQAERDASYSTIEEPLELSKALAAADSTDLVIVDCLTMWVNNLLYYNKSPKVYFESLCDSLPLVADVIMITNESSLCLIASDKASRQYMNLLAELNRKIAATADKVCLMVSGLPLWLKSGGKAT